MDVTECEIQRPKKTEKILQRKKEKTHVNIADAANKDIICISTAPGRKHDFKIFKENKVHFVSKTQVIADKCYYRITSIVFYLERRVESINLHLVKNYITVLLQAAA